MDTQDLKLLNELKVGIVGCGHLGQAIAQSLIAHGLNKESLLISYRGNPLTYQKLEANGLASCLTDNETLFKEAGIILIITRPQDVSELGGVAVSDKSIIVSCMAGVPIDVLNGIFKTEVYRMMFSGPDTISIEKGVAAAHPQNDLLEMLTHMLKLRYIRIGAEKDLDVFTAGVCLPAAILKLNNQDACSSAIEKIGSYFPLLAELYAWAASSLPDLKTGAEKDMYIERMCTKGGITEAIINSIQEGESLDAALIRGIDRSKEISSEISKTIANSEKK